MTSTTRYGRAFFRPQALASAVALLVLAALLAGPAPVAQAATFTVDSTGDGGDSNRGDGVCDDGSGNCTLRAAIEEANHANNSGLDTINFSIGSGVQTITTGGLGITDPVIIDGTTQPGFAGSPIIELDASGRLTGLFITGGGSTVKGLVINGTGRGIVLRPNGGNTIQGNYIGTDVSGTVAVGNSISGINIENSPNNTIGGTAAGEGNLISGNNRGISIGGNGATGNVVQGNLIGTDKNGTADLGNSSHGIIIDESNNTIGGTAAGAGNVISGNDADGVHFLGSSTTGNVVHGNYIGTDVNGTSALGNSRDGVFIGGAPNNTIGGAAAGAGNVISGNGRYGIFIPTGGATGNVVQGNLIGTDVSGTADVGNVLAGVRINLAEGNTIGGTEAGAGNVISGNDTEGVEITAHGNLVQGNLIGTDVNGTADLGNALNGVRIAGQSNTIGGTEAGAGNIISGNDSNGVLIHHVILSDPSPSNLVQGNYIGTDVTGTSDLGNTQDGVLLQASNATIGGVATGTGNTIAFNGGDGVSAASSGPRHTIRGNAIHTNAGLGIDLGADGVTANDPNDADNGPNNLQNFPTLTLATSGPATTTIGGDLDSLASTAFTIEFFSNIGCDPSGNGEGRSFLGSTMVTTDVNGDVSFSVSFGSAVPSGQVITATATDETLAAGSTSEFSACEQVTLDSDDDGDGFADSVDGCPSTPTVWPTPIGDEDCDGWTTANENFIGTNPNLACSTDNWPPDFNDSLQVDIFDVLFLAPPVFFSTPPGPPYDARLDLNADGIIIDIFDVLTMAPPIFFATCTP